MEEHIPYQHQQQQQQQQQQNYKDSQNVMTL